MPTPGPSESRDPLDLSTALDNVSFQERENATRHFAHLAKGISPALSSALPSLLAETPDPDAALMLFDRLVSSRRGKRWL